MEYLSDTTLLCVILVNIFSIMFFCIFDAKDSKNHTKKRMIAGLSLLAVTLLFDFFCVLGFIRYGVAENGLVFMMFIPLILYFMFETIKEMKR